MRYEHDAVTAVLTPGLSPAAVWGLVAVGHVAVVAVFVAVVEQSLVVGLASAGVLLAGLVWARRGPKPVELRVDARCITLSDGRTISLLDLYCAVADRRGFLVLQTQPGPLLDLWIPCRRNPLPDIQELAGVINAAIARASHRGDAPDEGTRAVQQLTERN